jgi:hypothetical protein
MAEAVNILLPAPLLGDDRSSDEAPNNDGLLSNS